MINLGVQLWFDVLQRFFFNSKNKIISSKIIKLEYYLSNKLFSRVLNRLKKKINKKTEFFSKCIGEHNLEINSLLKNENFYLNMTKVLNSFENKNLTSIRKDLSNSFCCILLNFIREQILFYWFENFLIGKNSNLKFYSLFDQKLKGYVLKFLKHILFVFFLWSIVFKKKNIFSQKHKKSYLNEFFRFTLVVLIFFKNKSLKDCYKEPIKDFFLDVQISSFKKKKNTSKKKYFKRIAPFFSFLIVKLLIQFWNIEKKSKVNSEKIFLFDKFINFDCLSIKIVNDFSFCGSFLKSRNFFFELNWLKILSETHLKHFISISIEICKKLFFYRFLFFFEKKNLQFRVKIEKKLKKYKMNQILEEKLNFCFWKTHFFLEFLNQKKSKCNFLLISLIKFNFSEKILNINILKSRIQKYLFLNYDFITLNIGPKILSSNILYQSMVFSFLKIIYKYKLKIDFYKIFYLSIVLVLMGFSFWKNINFFGGNFFFLNKTLFLGNPNNHLKKKKEEDIRLCEKICISLPSFDNLNVLFQYETGFQKIYKETNYVPIAYNKFKFKNCSSFQYKVSKLSFISKKNFEFLRDIVSYNNFKNKIKIIFSKIIKNSKNKTLFLPIKIYRNLRIISRFYFVQNLRDKQILWNFETIKILIQGSAVYMFKNLLYFFQINYKEAVLFLSFNRCNFIFDSELNFLIEIYDEKQTKGGKNMENKFFFSILKKARFHLEKFYLLNFFILLKHHIFKDCLFGTKVDSKYTSFKILDLFEDHVYITEAILMKVLKKINKIKSNFFIFIIRRKLFSYFNVDPRGILIQIKNLNKREYINVFFKMNFYFYL
jgi:hypothetical protein